jgi:L-seryl-tRNA(Ser) seleniumtransferase
MDALPDATPDIARLRAVPPLQKLLEQPQAQALVATFPRAAVVAALRGVLEETRALLRQGVPSPLDPPALLDRARVALEVARRPVLGRVINATGIILHTNLGRAPLAPEAVVAMAEVAGSYSNLEFNLASGERGSRTQGIEPLLRQLIGSESALAVNNNAAAVLLALSGLAAGGEVVVSRGELVEIGGGFRIPDVIQQGGARLVEVGTTNKTRIADYESAITQATRVLLKVHQSNFRITGFTEETSLAELVALAKARGLLVVHDLGSGTVVDLRRYGLPAETTVQESIASGVNVVAFSGDKLLGGPQSGLLAGRAGAIDRLRRHPLLRALRLDKLTLAALEATLRLHSDGVSNAVPTLRKMAQKPAELRARAEQLVTRLAPLPPGWGAAIVPTTGFAGGGTLPDAGIASIGVSLQSNQWEPEHIKTCLRGAHPPVIARITDGVALLDMLTIDDGEVASLAEAVRAVISA